MLKAIISVSKEKFTIQVAQISKRLKESKFLMADEARIKIGKKRGYAWVSIGEFGVVITVGKSCGGCVVDLHCPTF